MRTIVFDIETANWLSPATSDVADLAIAIVCTHDSQTDEYASYFERDLPKLWKVLERTDMLVGYNSDHFDIPILNKYYPGDLTRIKSLDLMKEIYLTCGRRLKLDAIAEGTLGIKKIGTGMQSLKWWREGQIEKVREYCLKDVEITKGIYDHAIKHGSLKYKELGSTREIKLDTSKWQDKTASPMTFSLGF